MNSLIEKFNSTNLDYVIVDSPYGPGYYWLRNKQGELTPELDTGSFGINVTEVMGLFCRLFNECFGEGLRSRSVGEYGNMELEVLWEYEGYILQLKEEYEHPRTGGVHLRMRIY